MVNLFIRAIRRAGIAVVYSNGFHPKPKLRFSDALPLGIESRCEELLLTVADEIDCRSLKDRLNAQLPKGLTVQHCSRVTSCSGQLKPDVNTYEVQLFGGRFKSSELEQFRNKDHLVVTRYGKKGRKRTVDLCLAVDHIELTGEETLEISLRSADGVILRPGEVLQSLFSLTDDQFSRARILKTAAN